MIAMHGHLQPRTQPVTGNRLLPAACCLLLCLSGCATYQFGNGTLYAPDVTTVYVPMVESASFRPDLGEALTEAIGKEIERRTPYKVVGDPNADSILTAKIIEDSKRLVVPNKFGEARDTDVNYQVRVTWINRKGDLICNGAVPLPPAFVNIGQSAAYIPEYGQSYTTAEYQIVKKLAQQIVGLMEKPW
jgi:Lipopolysaccharide-assembly